MNRFGKWNRSLRFDRSAGGRGRTRWRQGMRRAAGAGGRKGAGRPPNRSRWKKRREPDAYNVFRNLREGREDWTRRPSFVRGKVVKVSQGIMGKNWVHLGTASGDPGRETNNLVVTTKGRSEGRDVVTAKGTLLQGTRISGPGVQSIR